MAETSLLAGLLNPDLVRQLEQQKREANAPEGLMGQVQRVADIGSRSISQLAGVDRRSALEKQATDVQSAVQGAQGRNLAEKLANAAKNIQGRNPQAALILLQKAKELMPEAPTFKEMGAYTDTDTGDLVQGAYVNGQFYEAGPQGRLVPSTRNVVQGDRRSGGVDVKVGPTFSNEVFDAAIQESDALKKMMELAATNPGFINRTFGIDWFDSADEDKLERLKILWYQQARTLQKNNPEKYNDPIQALIDAVQQGASGSPSATGGSYVQKDGKWVKQ